MTTSKRAAELIAELEAQANPANVAGMARYGIVTDRARGVPIPALRAMAKRTGRDHRIATELWATGIHEARILASMVAEPANMTAAQMDRWVRDFDSWDVCDQVCLNLFRHSPFACAKATRWAGAKPEFVRRAAFALMAGLAAGRNQIRDAQFGGFLKLIAEAADDDRNMVKKAVNWALRQIGKRNPRLLREAMAVAVRMERTESRPARWIAKDALRELRKSTAGA